MIDALNFIVESIGMLFDYISRTIVSALQLFEIVVASSTLPPVLSDAVFYPLSICIIAISGIAVVKLIFGR